MGVWGERLCVCEGRECVSMCEGFLTCQPVSHPQTNSVIEGYI